MDSTLSTPRFSEISILWTIIGSMLLHMLFAVVIPNFDFSSPLKKPQLIKVELQKPTPPPAVEELPPIEIPEPPKPKPPEPVKKPKPIKKKVKPVVKPKPIKKEVVVPIEPPVEPPPPVVEEVIAVAPTVDSTAEVVVPVLDPVPVEPPPPPPPTVAQRSNALDAYSSQLGRAIAKHKSYPKIAQRRGWQGTVLLDIKVDSSGNVLSAVVSKSSGHKSLDKQALKMVKKASPFPTPPAILQGGSFNISVPVAFKLAN